MKDEIKDLLQYLKNVYESEETSTWLNKLQIKDLLDYITNLQTIEQQYSAILSENSELQGKVMKLKDELEKQRKEYQETYKDVRIEFKEKNETITNLQEENEYSDYCNKKLREKITNLEYKITTLEDYKTRNEKAIEYINKNITLASIIDGKKSYCLNDYSFDYEELLNLLQGKSDE